MLSASTLLHHLLYLTSLLPNYLFWSHWGAMLDCVTLPHASTLSQRLAGKDSAHGQQERQRIFSFCPVWLSLLIVWNFLGVSQTCKASRWTRRNGTVKLNLRKIRKLFWKGECVGSGCWLDFALLHCRDTWYWYAGLSPPWSPGLSSSQHLCSPGV